MILHPARWQRVKKLFEESLEKRLTLALRFSTSLALM